MLCRTPTINGQMERLQRLLTRGCGTRSRLYRREYKRLESIVRRQQARRRKAAYNGIDYGLGMANVDQHTGIRYGVIGLNSLNEWAWEDFEADYGPPTCGSCGNEAVEYNDEIHGDYDSQSSYGSCADFACEHCEEYFGSDEAYGDEPLRHTLDDGKYIAEVDSYNDVFIMQSPYFTYAQFCSPCAPGACHLNNPRDSDSGAARAYCFGPHWFNDETPPYDVYSVETGELLHKAGVRVEATP